MRRPPSGPVEPITYGSPRFRSREVGGLLVTDADFPPGSALPRHVHDRTCVALPIAGVFDSIMCGRTHAAGPGMLITEPAGEVHANRFGSAGVRIAIIQPDARREELLRPCASFLASITHRAEPAAGMLAKRLAAELCCNDAVADLAIEALALEIIVLSARGAWREESRTPRWLARIRDRLHDEIAQAHDLQSLAADAGVHPAHLTRAFRRQFGQSVGQYARRIRLEWAADRLATSEDLLADVAAEARFADQSHFTRLFRQQFGCTPGQYRRRMTSHRGSQAPPAA